MHRVGAVDVESKLPCRVRVIHLDRLPDDDARQLAAHLLEAMAPTRARHAGTIAREAQGHPLFIDELARHAALVAEREIPGDDPDDTAVLVLPAFDLDEALLARIGRLERPSRETLDLVAVAGRPLSQQAVAHAAGMEMGAFGRVVAQLRVMHLVHTSGARASDRIEPYHERVRAAVVTRLSHAERVACHQRLALALEAARWPDGEALSFHWASAGRPTRAAKYAVAAAHQAAEALAFDRAAACWDRALQLTPATDPKRRSLRVRLAEALANAGRGALAADSYSRAADEAPATEALDLRRRASEQFLRSGRFDEGIAAVREVLRVLGLKYPRSPLHALVQLVVLRMVLALRGMGYRERDPSMVPARDLTRVDMCWSVAFALGLSDNVYGAVFQVRAMLLALRAGEPTRVARALAVSAGYGATGGGRAATRVTRHLEKAMAIAERTQDAQCIAYAIANSAVSHYLSGSFRRAVTNADRAEAMFRDRVPGTAWEQATMHHFALISLVHLGSLRELQERQPVYLRNALDRGDIYGSVCMRTGYASFAWLVRGDPAGARREVTEAMHTWSKEGCHLEHFYELIALVNADLYEGARGGCVRAGGRPVGSDATRGAPADRDRASAIPGRAREVRPRARGRRPGARSPLLAAAERDARRIARTRSPWAAPLAGLIRASAASVRSDLERAIALLRDAVAGFEAAEMAMHATAARWRLAQHLGSVSNVGPAPDAERRALESQTGAWMREQGVVDPDALVAVVAPGFSGRWIASRLAPGDNEPGLAATRDRGLNGAGAGPSNEARTA